MQIELIKEELFSQIAPRWAQILKTSGTYGDMVGKWQQSENRLDIDQFDGCIAGEVYCMTDAYKDVANDMYCKQCELLSCIIGGAINSAAVSELVDSEPYDEEWMNADVQDKLEFVRRNIGYAIDAFMFHLEESHADLVEQKKKQYAEIKRKIENASCEDDVMPYKVTE